MADKTRGTDSVGRREFLIRCTKAGVSLAAAGALAHGFYDPLGLSGHKELDVLPPLPDFFIPEMKNKMAIVRGADRVETIRVSAENETRNPEHRLLV